MSARKSNSILAVLACAAGYLSPACVHAQATVKVEPSTLDTPRPLAEQTAQAAVRDYLEAWQGLSAALDQNRAELLDADFAGDARDKLAGTIRDQAQAGLRSLYQDRAHDVRIVFYSPEGLSIEIEDTVDYDVQVLDHDKAEGTQHVHARYLVVLTPSELRWRVRVMQSQGE